MRHQIAESAPRAPVEIWKGDAARARLGAPSFREQWERLYAECPWASVCQSYGYAATWYDFYRDYAPLLVAAVDGDGSLRGLLPLAVGRDGELVAAGARQAEYQVWLACPEQGDDFIESALERLAAEFPNGTLTLRYLPPATPRGWLARPGGAARWCALSTSRRGIIDVREAKGQEAFGKKHRSRMRKLERVGPVAYERVVEPEAIDALLEEIAPLCDLRHGALHDILPFRGDPAKLPFHRALARVPGLLQVSVLRCGDQIASVDVDADDRGQLTLWLSALSPRFARHSPGRLHTLLKLPDLAGRGYRAVDLTPGDDYKDAMATRFEDVYALRVFFGARQRAAWRSVSAVRRAAKTVMARAGVDPEALRQSARACRLAIDAAGPGPAPMRTLRAVKARLWEQRETELYEFDRAIVAALPMQERLRLNCIPDLIGYRRGLLSFEPRRVFLRRAWARLERGSHVYTRVEGPDLATAAWVSSSPGAVDDAALMSGLPPDAALVHDLAATAVLSHADEWVAVLPQLLRGAAGLPHVARVLLAVPAGRRDLSDAVRGLGGVRAGSVHEEVRGRRARRWSTIQPAPRGTLAGAEPAEVRA